ncbi:MAG: Uma2 family endonuclease [Thermoguttaceae bacterium]|nr:Uma2 family endonuclease [Thermoguttaceae bacterium]
MSLIRTVYETEYPESDGMPMGETDLHRDWMIRILDILRWRYRGQRVYVASNLLLYYTEGDPTKFVVPDVFVVLDCDPAPRNTYKIWEEGDKAPHAVFEVTSRSTRREDEIFKPRDYARLGIAEYFLYDPTSDYLKPPLQGFRADRGSHTRIVPDDTGALRCESLGITLRLEQDSLVLRDSHCGEVLQTEAEAAEAARQAAETAQQAAQTRIAELEAEVRRLQAELRRAKRDT